MSAIHPINLRTWEGELDAADQEIATDALEAGHVLYMPGLRFEPKVHVNYAEKAVPIRDGLPKMKDLPKEMGGSGETLPE